jgi:nucleoside-diphosphate-sugar epimerase
MRVFVLGGTGAIGGHAVPALVAAGHAVTAIARSPEKADVVRRAGATPATVSLFDRAGLRDAFAGHDAIVNLASALPSTGRFVLRRAWRENDRVRIEGSANIAAAAQDAGVPRLIQESVSMLYPDRGDAWIDEGTAPARFFTSMGNIGAEASASRFAETGGDALVLRFGWFIGPGARHSEQFLALARWRLGVSLGSPHGFVSSIHLDDAARAVVTALNAPPGTYNVVDDEPLTKADFATALAAAAGKTSLIRGPGRLAALLGDRLASLTRSLRVSNRLLRDTTDWRPRYPSAREAWLATASVVRDRRERSIPKAR